MENNFSDSVAADTLPKPTPVIQDSVKYSAVRYRMPRLGPPVNSDGVLFDGMNGSPVTLANVDNQP